jgi:hypothetical protein
LAEIHSRAVDIGKNLSYGFEINGKRVHSDTTLFQAYCYAEAMTGYFRAKGIILHEVKFGDQKDENKRGLI